MIIIRKQLTGLGAHAFLHRHSFVLSLHKGGRFDMAAAILLLDLAFLVDAFFAVNFCFFAGADLVTGFFWAATAGREAVKKDRDQEEC